jgi:sugar phosphate isomerase/epimerase
MKLGVLTLLLGDRPLEETLDYLASLGVEAVEFGAGAYVKSGHFDTAEFLQGEPKVKWLKNAAADRKLIISSLSCHGNPLHPNPAIAKAHHEDFVNTCRVARKLGVDQVNTLSGCPGSDPRAQLPSWITCPFPAEDFLEALEWQWNEKAIPYWREAARIARDNGVRVGIEMVPNCLVYNAETLLRLRDAAGETIGANLDPSHLFWQGADIGAVIRRLAPAIYHFHAKDSAVNPYVAQVNGVIDAKPLTDEANRAWIFRTVGYGHDQSCWNNIVAQLRMAGYDHVLSIEHEDSLMSADEGLRRAVQFLRQTLIREKPGRAYWAE